MSNLIIKRPKEIFELFSSLGSLSGVGEKKLNLFEKKIGPYLINLLFYLPHKSINRFQNISSIFLFLENFNKKLYLTDRDFS